MLEMLEKRGLLFLDGAMGTQLQAKGLMPGEIPELWNLARPGDVRAVHEAYYAAGSDIVYGKVPRRRALGGSDSGGDIRRARGGAVTRGA